MKILVGLGESSFLLLEYSVEHLIEYSSTRQGVRRIQPSVGHPSESEGYCAKSSLSTDARQLW